MTQEALKLALEALYPIAHNTTDDPRGQAYKAITALEEVLAQPEQEPVACERCKQLEEHAYNLVGELRVANIKLSMRPQRKPLSAEKVSEICAEWTDENGNTGSFGRRQIARAIEAAHGIKE